MENRNTLLRPESKHGYTRESLKSRGYKGINEKLNLFEAREPSRLWRNSRVEVAESAISSDIKVRDLVNRFETARPSNIPKPIRHKIERTKGTPEKVSSKEKGDVPSQKNRTTNGKPIKNSESSISSRNSIAKEINKNTQTILRATVKIITRDSPEVPVRISHRSEAKRVSSKTSTNNQRSSKPTPAVRNSVKSNNITIGSRESVNKKIAETTRISCGSISIKKGAVDKDKNLQKVAKSKPEVKVSVTAEANANQPLLYRQSKVEKEREARESEFANDSGGMGKPGSDHAVQLLDTINNQSARPKTGLGSSHKRTSESGQKAPIVCRAATERVKSSDHKLEEFYNFDKTVIGAIDGSILESVASENINETSENYELKASSKCGKSAIQSDPDDKDLSITECAGTSFGASSDNESRNDTQKFNRTTWRSKALRKRTTGSSEQFVETKKLIEEQELFQTYTEKEEEHLRQSIIRNEANIGTVANYLLVRNGNKATIRILKQINPMPQDTIAGPGIMLWQNLTEVATSGVLETLTKQQISRQEALFEIITSQASYVKSLAVLEEYFLVKIKVRVPYVLKEKEYNELFFHIKPMFAEERALLEDMLELCEDDIMMDNLCDLVANHYNENREMYLKYGRHQDSVLQHYQHLCEVNPKFQSLVKDLSNSKDAGFLPFDSYLNLPTQRVTKMPLLLKTVIAQTARDSQNYSRFADTLAAVERVAQDLNDEAGKMRQWEEMLKLDRELDMPDSLIRLPLIQNSRYIVLRSWCRRIEGKKSKIKLILFNDVFVVAKKTNTQSSKPLQVCDYAERHSLTMKARTQTTSSGTPMHLQFNSDMHKRQMTLVFIFEKASDNTRWLNALSPTPPNDIGDLQGAYSQVVITKKYDKKFPDELSLNVGDLVTVIFDENDGWSLGEKLVDGSQGWFRISNSQAISSPSDQQFMQETRQQLRKSEQVSVHIQDAIGDESNA